MGQIAAGIPGVEGKFQHLHARQAGILQKLLDAWGGIAQVLGDEPQLGEPAGEHPHQAHARALDPMAVFGGGLAVGHGPIGLEAPEMVDADHVIQLGGTVYPADPPAEAVGLHPVPGVQGVAPELTVGAEVVRRHAGYLRGNALVVQLEALRLRPHVGGVHGHINGQVANDLDVQAVEEQELQIGKQLHVLPQQGAVPLQHLRGFPQADVRVLPLRPGAHAKMALAGHVQGVVRQPAAVLRLKGGHLCLVPDPAPVLGLLQHGEAALVDLSVVHVPGFGAPVLALHLIPGQQPVLYQHIQVDEIGIPSVGGKALIGGVAIAGGAQGQHLPAALPGGVEKIGKVIGGLAQSPDAVGRRQGKYRHQNAAATIHMSVNSLIRKMLCFFSPLRLRRPHP